MHVHVIHLHPHAPDKPAEGAACNGCGVCCASEPCPAGVLVTGRRHGACAALEWAPDAAEGDDASPTGSGRYRCGLVVAPRRYLPRLLQPAAPAAARLALRMISAGSGCDCSLQAQRG